MTPAMLFKYEPMYAVAVQNSTPYVCKAQYYDNTLKHRAHETGAIE